MSVSGPEKRDADARADLRLRPPPRAIGRPSWTRMPVERLLDAGVVDRAVQQDGELVAAEARGGVRGPHALVQPLRRTP